MDEDCWEEGYAAYYAGTQFSQCPYSDNCSDESQSWRRGWQYAAREATRSGASG